LIISWFLVGGGTVVLPFFMPKIDISDLEGPLRINADFRSKRVKIGFYTEGSLLVFYSQVREF
jgi:hypothetical protein